MLEINQYKPKQQTNAYITQDKLNSGKYLQICNHFVHRPGFEPGTSWSKVQHSTTMPFPPPNTNCSIVKTLQNSTTFMFSVVSYNATHFVKMYKTILCLFTYSKQVTCQRTGFTVSAGKWRWTVAFVRVVPKIVTRCSLHTWIGVARRLCITFKTLV